ncbi:type II secretion system protein GspM [Marinobacter salicampi]|uniref:type II secretion system protein GspM n=1 Tax=Marinobacter salicampi TaxID=435907 RepID=UPI00140BDEA3|nr:type II secretion system protein M [Marinobacter salicampi]
MLAKLRENPSLQKLVAQYDQLSQRDQKALWLMAVALLLALLYFAVWRPVAGFHDNAELAHERAQSLVVWMENNRAAIAQLSENRGDQKGSNRITSGRALMSTVTSSAREAGIALQRFEPSGENALRVWLENVPFSQVAAWLEALNTDHGILVDQAALDSSDQPGQVSARLTLQI